MNTHYTRAYEPVYAELDLANDECRALRNQVAELDARNKFLLATNDAMVTRLTELATKPLHQIVTTRLAVNALVAGLAVKNNEHVQNFVAFPKFAARHTATTVKALWSKLPRVRVEW
jgi:hypothetical protein